MEKWKQQSEAYRKLIEGSMDKYSQKLEWGLTGSQEECWTLLDMAVDQAAVMARIRKAVDSLDKAHRGDMAVIGKIFMYESGLL